ncbi:MAG: 50S ribosomal protein L37ae [Candidatus Bathyarchaeia archaeon]
MGRTKKIGPTGGLKARYGATVRKRYIEVVTEAKKSHTCPQCKAATVKRQSVGLWKCRKCGLTFTGGAYTPSTKLGSTAKRAAKAISAES